MNASFPSVILQALGAFDTCAIANTIETFNIQLRNEGYTDSTLHCRFPELPPIVGYAVTLRVHSGSPPMEGGVYRERADWWEYLEAMPRPSIMVIEDADRRPGSGAFIGEVHAAILQALGCVGVVTNGAVRDLSAVQPTGFQLFSGSISVSHAYMHVAELNVPVHIGGLRLSSGDLLHGDRHGLVRIPPQLAAELPAAAERLRRREERILAFCRSSAFTKEGLQSLLREAASGAPPQL